MKIISQRATKRQVLHDAHLQGAQAGFFLLEALIAILIFSLGILGLVAMGTLAVQAQSDAEYRTQAAAYANQIIGEMWVNTDRSTIPLAGTSVAAFQHNPTTTSNCVFAGAASAHPAVASWVSGITTAGAGIGLPGAVASGQQILVDRVGTGDSAYNKVTVTVCWKAPKDIASRQHIVISYVN